MPKFASIDAYIAALPEPARGVATNLRRLILATAPGAVEAIRYDMPAFQIGKTTFLHFGCWKNHVGIYPVYRGDAAFEALVGPFRSGKDTVRLQYRDTLPTDVVIRIVNARVQAG